MEALDLPGLKLACCAECAHLDRRGDETRHLTTHVWISHALSHFIATIIKRSHFLKLAWKGSPV